MITKKHDDIAQAYLDRMARDQCSPSLTWNFSDDGKKLVSVTLAPLLAGHLGITVAD